jgi:dipeptide/tripeptide permease
MSSKTLMYLGVTIGSIIGGYLPALWGGSLFSVAGVLTSSLGGAIGLVITYKLIKN